RPMPRLPPVTKTVLCLRTSLNPQERFDRAALIHGAIALGDLIQRQHQVEDLAGVECSFQDEINQLGQIRPDRSRAAMQMDVAVEQILALEHDPVWYTDIADV